MCLHYFSDSLGFTFNENNEEVYRIDQIKEWATTETEIKWLEVPDILVGQEKERLCYSTRDWPFMAFK